MKYQKGDKVIILDLSYFQNPYHYKEYCIKEYTVLDANENYFSPYYKECLNSLISGCNDWSIFYQSNGCSLYGEQKVYHKEKDRELILSLIKEAIEKYDNNCKDNDNKRKQELENIILQCQQEIKQIENGNGNWKVGFTTYNNNEYKEKVLTEIRKIFSF